MLRIAVDIDEVLCPFFRPMAIRAKKKLPRAGRKYPYVYREALDITEEESRQMVTEFYRSDEFKNLQPFPFARETLYQLKGKDHKLYAVTGRQAVARKGTEEWLENHFPYVFEDLVLTNSYTPYEIPKSHLCLSMGLNVIIDDNMATCRDCEMKGIQALNYTGDQMYPWCEPSEISVRNWIDVWKEFSTGSPETF